MTDPSPSEFVNGRHWAEILGCDMRASVQEIERAFAKRVRELAEALCIAREVEGKR